MDWFVTGDLPFYFLGFDLNIWSWAQINSYQVFQDVGDCLKIGLEK